MTEYPDAGLELLDRQLVDADGTSLGEVDDLLFTDPGPDDGPPVLGALLVGQQAFGARLAGRDSGGPGRPGGCRRPKGPSS
jgi:hypothetical protein